MSQLGKLSLSLRGKTLDGETRQAKSSLQLANLLGARSWVPRPECTALNESPGFTSVLLRGKFAFNNFKINYLVYMCCFIRLYQTKQIRLAEINLIIDLHFVLTPIHIHNIYYVNVIQAILISGLKLFIFLFSGEKR